MSRITGSAAQRVKAGCLFNLPASKTPPLEIMERGTAGHLLSEGLVKLVGCDDAIDDPAFWPRHSRRLRLEDGIQPHAPLERFPDLLPIFLACQDQAAEIFCEGSVWETETPLAWNPITKKARRLKSDGHRDYSRAKKGEWCTTLDALSLLPASASAVIVDHKWPSGDHIDPARYEATQEFHASAVDALTRAGDLNLAEITYLLLFWLPDGLRVVETVYDRGDLDRIADQWRQAAQRQRLGDTVATPGQHCKSSYCSGLREGTCPAVQDIGAAALVKITATGARRPALPRIFDGGGGELTTAQAAETAALLPALKSLVANADAATRRAADAAGGLTLADGSVYSGRTHHSQKITLNDAGIAALRALGAEGAVSPATTKAALRRTLGSKEGLEQAMAALDGAGCVTSVPVTKYEIRKP